MILQNANASLDSMVKREKERIAGESNDRTKNE
jgi:hypothetical protein